MERSIASSLCRFKVDDEHLITDRQVKNEIARAFEESRCFEFYLDNEIISGIKQGNPVELYRERFIGIRNYMFDTISEGNQNVNIRLTTDTRLSSRLIAALIFSHKAVAEGNFTTVMGRRIVIVKELPGIPTIYYVSKQSTVIAHVGQGPQWMEIPTIYLGLKTFDALTAEQKKGHNELFKAFKLLLMIEERAIETGYTHSAVYPPEVPLALNYLVDEVIANATQFEIEEIKTVPGKKEKAFTDDIRQTLIRDLNARVKDDELNFNYEKNMLAMKKIERIARRYKQENDYHSLRETVRVLVAASGHDIHEIRNRSNLILEKIFAPKEFDAPLATRFINVAIGNTYTFTFDQIEDPGNYSLRIYKNSCKEQLFLEKDIEYDEIELIFNEDNNSFSAEYTFASYGHFDFIVMRNSAKTSKWITKQGTSGRVNVIPDVRGEIILEIFTDIHGHAKTYWYNNSGHPGLVYNENGEVIRLGNFADISAHIEELKNQYHISAIYLLGVQKRGNNRHDWAPEASSPSPFSPMSLIDIEPFLGGEEELKKLITKAHSLDIKIIVDIVPHINRSSDHLPDDYVVFTYNHEGQLVANASTDGRYGAWNDGKLLNYRKFETWEWMAKSIDTLIDTFDIDGIRFDSAHAVPIMMKKNNYLYTYNQKRSNEDMLEGTIIVNDREYDHLVTTGYYDCSCRDIIAVPFHYYLMLRIQKKLSEKKKDFFLNIAECFWGHERFLTRTGLIPYNASLFKICENIVHGKTDVREIYHIYDHYFPTVLSEGTELLGILGNHDERRALNTFGHRGLRASVVLTMFMSNIIMDYEGSAEGEGWKVFLDNIYVNWNQFEYASHRSLEHFYKEWYSFHRTQKGKGHLVWANNHMIAASVKFVDNTIWIGAFNFSDSNQSASIQFDNPRLPINNKKYFRLSDYIYSGITKHYNYFSGEELKISKINTIVSYTERIKILKLEEIPLEDNYHHFIKDSFIRLCEMANVEKIKSNFFFSEFSAISADYDRIKNFLSSYLIPEFWNSQKDKLILGLKRTAFYLVKNNVLEAKTAKKYVEKLIKEKDPILSETGSSLLWHNKRGSLVFMSAEADPFSKSGGLANVVYELPRELVKLKEKVYVITGYYRNGDDKAQNKMHDAVKKYNVTYTGTNVRFNIMEWEYEVGVHYAHVEGIHYYLLDHHEFFDGLYWGTTSAEKLRRRIAFARSCAEVITNFNLNPQFTFSNDAYVGLFNGIVRADHFYMNNENFRRTTFLHIIHNGGWQYFDAYHRYEQGFDLFSLFNLPTWRGTDFTDPVNHDRLNCMATGIRFADKTITVSPSYAKQVEYQADGLERILHNVIGISNAIGRDFQQKLYTHFENSNFVDDNYKNLIDHIKQNDELQNKIETRYPEILKGPYAVDKIKDEKKKFILTRMRNKLLIQKQRGLTVDPDIILFTFIHRVTEQKGFQLLLEASEGIFRHLGFQGIIGGAIASGDQKAEEIAHGLYLLSQYHPNQINLGFGFQDVRIPLMSCDLFLMPSMQEPGGISQLEAFAAGVLVVARATGGLRDTVFPIRRMGDQIEGNGFLFSDYSPWSFYDAMERAHIFLSENDDDTIYKARKNAENSIYFWDKPAREYVEHIYNMTETIRIFD